MNEKKLGDSDLDLIKMAKSRLAASKLLLEKAALEDRVTNLEYQNLILRIYFKYDLSAEDSIDENTGTINRNRDGYQSDNISHDGYAPWKG